MRTRELVTGKYINKENTTYALYKEDGSVFQIIKEYEPFRIGNQNREFVPVSVPKKNGNGTILMCQKFGNNGDVIEQFPLPHGKKGLWALTSGAARRGVFHRYNEPKTELEKVLASMGISTNLIERVPSIDVKLEVGGELCHHVTKQWGYGCVHDGSEKDLNEPDWVPDTFFNQYHRGCMCSTYTTRVTGGTYAIYYSIGTYMNGSNYRHIERVIVTPEADGKKVIEEIKKIVNK